MFLGSIFIDCRQQLRFDLRSRRQTTRGSTEPTAATSAAPGSGVLPHGGARWPGWKERGVSTLKRREALDEFGPVGRGTCRRVAGYLLLSQAKTRTGSVLLLKEDTLQHLQAGQTRLSASSEE